MRRGSYPSVLLIKPASAECNLHCSYCFYLRPEDPYRPELLFRQELPFRVSIRDIAPTALHLLGLPVPEDMDGKVITHALTEEFMASHPVQTAAPQSFVGGGRGGMEFAGGFASEEDEKLIRQRLTALGYLD